MEITKYLCEFFFTLTNIWHFVGLLLICGALGGTRYNYKRKG